MGALGIAGGLTHATRARRGAVRVRTPTHADPRRPRRHPNGHAPPPRSRTDALTTIVSALPLYLQARSSVVEHYLDTVGVVGSIPIEPTNQPPEKSGGFLLSPQAVASTGGGTSRVPLQGLGTSRSSRSARMHLRTPRDARMSTTQSPPMESFENGANSFRMRRTKCPSRASRPTA
jgi:hypothetical protein